MSGYGVRIDDGPLLTFDTLEEAERFVHIVGLGMCLRSPEGLRIDRLSPLVSWWLIGVTILLAWWAS